MSRFSGAAVSDDGPSAPPLGAIPDIEKIRNKWFKSGEIPALASEIRYYAGVLTSSLCFPLVLVSQTTIMKFNKRIGVVGKGCRFRANDKAVLYFVDLMKI